MVLAWGNNDRGGLGFSITWQESPLLIMRPTSSWNFFSACDCRWKAYILVVVPLTFDNCLLYYILN